KFDFFKNVEEYNRTYPELYARTAGYTYREATYLDLQASNNQLRFNAYVTTPTDVARLMLGLSNSPDFQGLPRVTGVPNYSPEEEARRRAAAVAQTMPGSTIIGGFIPGQEGSGAYPGSYPGSEGMMPSDMGSYPGGDSGNYPGGDSGSYPG